MGARLRGRPATQRSKKGSEKVLERVLGPLWVLQHRVLRRVLRRGSEKGVSRSSLEPPLVEYPPLRHAP